MVSLEKSDSAVSTNVRYRMPAVHPEGRKFVVIAVGIVLFFWLIVGWHWAAWLMAGISLWVAAFFRDPIRTTPNGDGLIIAPADGLVTMIANVMPPAELAGEDGLGNEPVVRVSIFMSVFDVHIN
ncbi:MAG: phosphatidylserine decarboxylase, partial [Alphaproteobacteria bacterium]|nr:phosphatidylserine decarboxylase [Alphaproteobacteria bacterium]